MFKKFGILLFVLILLLAGGLFYLNTNLNAIVKDALERYGSAATQTDVNISSVRISLTTGKGTVSGIKIGNPKAYVAATALKLGEVDMLLDTQSIRGSGPIIIKQVNITKPYVIYEVGADGNSNLQDIQKNVSKATSTSKPSKNARKVIIRDLYIRNGKIGITHALLKGRDIKTDLPLIHLRNIGQEGEGATPQQISKQVLGQITTKAAQAGAQALAEEIGSLKNLNKDEIMNKAKGSLKGLFGN